MRFKTQSTTKTQDWKKQFKNHTNGGKNPFDLRSDEEKDGA